MSQLINRNIILSNYNISVLSYEIQEIPLVEVGIYSLLGDTIGDTGVLVIQVDDAWSASDDLVLDAFLVINSSGEEVNEADIIPLDYEASDLPGPVSTNSTVFQPVLTHTFFPSGEGGDYEIHFNWRWNSPTQSQRTEFRFLLNGVPHGQTYIKEPKDTEDTQLVSYSLELTGLEGYEEAQTAEFEFRKVNGGSLVTVESLRISTNKIR